MWCARWFVPLLVLPIPSAQPYFLLVAILSMFVDTRPCFYCVVLLSALFVSSCHWSPVPIDSSLSRPYIQPWGNATTFREALDLPIMQSLPTERRPTMIRFLDRCWCDLSVKNLFEPFDIVSWEVSSVRWNVLNIHEAIQEENNSSLSIELAMNETETGQLASEGLKDIAPKESSRKDTFLSALARVAAISNMMQSLTTLISDAQSENTAMEALGRPPLRHPSTPASAVKTGSTDQRDGPETRLPLDPKGISPWEIDLRPFGFSILLDFTWSPYTSSLKKHTTALPSRTEDGTTHEPISSPKS